MSEITTHPTAALLRGFAVEFLTAHDLEAPARIMSPDYRLTIGGHVLDGRDGKYVPATAEQLRRFPGLCVTVHDIVIGEHAAAIRFAEHGASLRHGGQYLAWGGVALFRIVDGRLDSCWAEEDYFARKRQLAAGLCDPIEPPHPAPWDAEAKLPNDMVESSARAWLERTAALTDYPQGPKRPSATPTAAELIDVESTRINMLFCAGDRVAFHAEQTGSYAGGFDDIDTSAVGKTVVLRSAGLLTVGDSGAVSARVISDRLGLYYDLGQS